MAVPPVARMTSVFSDCMNSLISGILGRSMTWITASGAPAASAASASVRTASIEHSRAAGCGHSTMALRVINADSTLK